MRIFERFSAAESDRVHEKPIPSIEGFLLRVAAAKFQTRAVKIVLV
jgi:hypothetical protein